MSFANRTETPCVALDLPALDIMNVDSTMNAVAEARPDVVFNCAAYTDVDGAEKDADSAMAVNAQGAANLAAAAAEVGAAIVYPSTDYVFDGGKGAPYVESDPINPLSVYGRSKAEGEKETRRANDRHFIVRTSWLFGVGGRNFVETMIRLGRDRDRLSVVDDQVGCPTFTGHLAAGIVEIVDRGSYGVFHLAAGGSCSWREFAEAILAAAGMDVRVEPTTTEAFGSPAQRPAHSVLRSERPNAVVLPSWRDGLAEYMLKRSARAVAR